MNNEPRVGLIGAVGTCVDTCFLHTRDLIEVTTENLGNLLFRYAVQDFLRSNYVPIDFGMNPRHVREMVDVVVYPTANQVNPKLHHLDFHSNWFEAVDRPLIVCGLGAQYPLSYEGHHNLAPSTIRYLRVVSNYSHSIGVRGEFTRKILERLGITNAVVIGCPSNFLNGDDDAKLAQVVAARLDAIRNGRRPLTKVAVQPQSGGNYYNENHSVSEKFLFDICIRNRGFSYVVNGPAPLYSLARNRMFETVHQGEWQELNEFLSPTESHRDFLESFKKVSIAFTSLQSWMEHLSSQDMVIGKRIHGSIAAIQSRIPSILFVHDSRTMELATTIGLPYININDEVFGSEKLNFDDVVQKVTFDPSVYSATRAELRDKFISLFRPHRIKLKNAGGPGI